MRYELLFVSGYGKPEEEKRADGYIHSGKIGWHKTVAYSGYFIALEGIDGSGISTQVERVGQILSTYKRKVLTTKQPSTGPVGSLIRQILAKRLQGVSAKTLALLFAADRRDHVEHDVGAVLQAGGIVLCDRYLWSTLAYQGLELDTYWLCQINDSLPTPDLTVFIKVRPAISMKRIATGRLRTELFEREHLLTLIYNAYVTLVAEAREAGQRVVVVDGEQSVEAVTAEIVAALLHAFPDLREQSET